MTTDPDNTVGVVGLGYVGLPLATSLSDVGYDVVGVDIDERRLTSIREGRSYLEDVGDDQVRGAFDDGLTVTSDYSMLSDAAAVSICVPTPMQKTGAPDLSHVVDVAEDLKEVIAPETTVILESTVYPGATEEIVAGTFEDDGWTVGKDVFVAHSPERIDPGNEEHAPTEIPKVLGGITSDCGDRSQALYEPVFDEIVRVSSAREAEFTKLLENSFRIVNIGFVNELAQIAHRLDVDLWEVIDAAATKPFGFMPFYPGPGLGGHCIPLDPLYLSWRANQQDIETRFIDLAKQTNREMPKYVVQRTTEILNDHGIPLPDAQILLIGVAYKPDVSDTRESPAYDLIEQLIDRDATVSYHDPHVPEVSFSGRRFESVPLDIATVEKADCVIILTDHSNIDIETISENASLLFDTRNATKRIDTVDSYKL